jgi:ATP-binding cassette subfamily B protein
LLCPQHSSVSAFATSKREQRSLRFAKGVIMDSNREQDRVSFAEVVRLWASYWRRSPGSVALITGCISAAVACDVTLPLITREIAHAVEHGQSQRAALMVGTFLASAAAFYVFWNIGQRRLNRMTIVHMQALVQETFARVQRASTDWHANTFAGSTVRKVTRGMWAFDTMSETVMTGFIATAVMLGGSLTVMAFQHPLMALLSGAALGVYIVVSVLLATRYVAPVNRLANAQDSALSGTLADAITCNAAVKAFGAEAREEQHLHGALNQWHTLTLRNWTRIQTMIGVMNALTLVNMAVLIGMPVWLWQQGTGSAADVAYGITAYFLLQGSARNTVQNVQNLQKASNELEDVVRLHRMKLAVDDVADAQVAQIGRGEIRFRSVDFAYANTGKPIYRNFSLHIKAGEKIGLVGTSGSGKSTFVKLLQRLYDVDGGVVEVDGQDIRQLDQSSLRARIALVPQEPVLFHRSLAENIRYGKVDASDEEVVAAAKQAHAHGFISKLPDGYATLVGERGVKLSGGERQRVAIARAILADAPILVLDEATSSLDSVSEALIQDALDRLMEGRTTLIVAHRLSTLRAVDRILVFENGRVVEQGSHDALLAIEDGHYRRLYETQQMGLQEAALELT